MRILIGCLLVGVVLISVDKLDIPVLLSHPRKQQFSLEIGSKK